MNVAMTIRTLLGLPPKISVLLEANHGLGKSSVVAQVAAMMSERLCKPFTLIDFRLAQCEVGDLIGMQRSVPQGEVIQQVYTNGVRTEEVRKVINVTVHDLASWFPTDPDSCGFLFLDELPRAPRDVQNAVLELALDYRFHFRSLPVGWRVVSASNDNMDVYSGTQLDPALYDRFLKIKFKPTHPEWIEYAEKNNVHRAIIAYLMKDTMALGIEAKPEPGKVTPTPRSWCKFSECLTFMAKNGDDPMKDHTFLTLLAKGWIGDLAIPFVDYVKRDYKIWSAEDILNKFNDNLDKEFKSMLVTEIAFYSTELIEYMKREVKALSKKQGENLLRWYKAIPVEAASGFWSKFSAECKETSALWYKMKVTVNGKETSPVQDYTFGFLAKARAMK